MWKGIFHPSKFADTKGLLNFAYFISDSQGGRRRGDFSKPSLRGPPQKYSRSKKDGKPKGQAAPGRSVQVYHEVLLKIFLIFN